MKELFDKNKIKNSLTIEQVMNILILLGANPTIEKEGVINSETICHNNPGEAHGKKLYYYDNTKLFKCYTQCNNSFDIFELICKVKKIQENEDFELPEAVRFITNLFGISPQYEDFNIKYDTREELENLSRLKKIKEKDNKISYIYKKYDDSILNNLTFIPSIDWLREGITVKTMKKYGIKYYAKDHKIVIPHYDVNNNLIGIRGRSMVQEDINRFGKYMPLTVCKIMYNHPLSYNLYGLNQNLKNIEKYGRIILFEGEKSVMLYDSLFGSENNVSVATCGHTITLYQLNILKNIKNLKEVIIGYDKQFKKIGDDEFIKDKKLLTSLNDKLKNEFNTGILFDQFDILDYKDSPIDKGKEKFEYLFKNKIIL